MIDAFTLERIRSALDLPRMIEARTPKFRRVGSEYMAMCPFHDDRTPSLAVWRPEAVWRFHCFACGATGDGIDFISRTEGLGFVDAVSRAAAMVGVEMPDLSRMSAKERDELERAAIKERTGIAMLRAVDALLSRMAAAAAAQAQRAQQEVYRCERLWYLALGKFGEGHALTNERARFLAKAYDALSYEDYRFETLNEAASADTTRPQKVKALREAIRTDRGEGM